MAVSKIWNVNSRLDKVINYGSNEKKTTNPDYDPLKTVLDYGDNPDKTEKQLYSTGINCDAEFAYQQFMTVKMQYGKTDGILGYHGYMSFSRERSHLNLHIKSELKPPNEFGVKDFKWLWILI